MSRATQTVAATALADSKAAAAAAAGSGGGGVRGEVASSVERCELMRRSASAGSILLDLAAASRELAPAATESSAASASAWSLQGRGGGGAAAAAAAGGSRGDRRRSKGPSSDPTPLGVPHGSPHGRRERVPGPGPELLRVAPSLNSTLKSVPCPARSKHSAPERTCAVETEAGGVRPSSRASSATRAPSPRGACFSGFSAPPNPFLDSAVAPRWHCAFTTPFSLSRSRIVRLWDGRSERRVQHGGGHFQRTCVLPLHGLLVVLPSHRAP